MEASLSWRGIDGGAAGALLCAAAAVAAAAAWPAVRFSIDGLPLALAGRVGLPEDRVLARDGERALGRGDLGPARGLLEASLALEPNGRVRRLLGEARERTGDADGALADYLSAVRLDPMDASPCLKAASILRDKGRAPRARALLEGCLGAIEASARLHVPRPDPAATPAQNDKARARHAELSAGAWELRAALGPPPADAR